MPPIPPNPAGGMDVPILKLPWCGGRERPPYGAGANAAADREIAAAQGFARGAMALPYEPRANARPNGKPQPCGIANLCRGRCLHRPGNHAAAQGPAGGINPGPYGRWHGPRPNGKLQPSGVANPCRGRCLHRPGNPAAAQGPAGGINPAPTDDGTVPGQTGNYNPAALQTRVGGRCLHRPGEPRGGRRGSAGGISGLRAAAAAAVALRNAPAGAVNNSRPYESILCFGPTGMARRHPGGRRAGCPHPAGPCRRRGMFRF